jgi:ribosomal protein L11 methyltransferase
MDWLEVIVPVPAIEADDVAAMLADELTAAAAGTELRGAEVVFWVPFAEGEQALMETRAAVSRLAAGGSRVDPARVHTQPAMPEAEWRDAWKKYFHAVKLTRQIVVAPTWEPYTAAPGEVVVTIDPGMAFGTGAHASTRLVLEELQRMHDGGDAPPPRFVDVGTGSGILAIAACLLWPQTSGLAIDNDAIAVRAASENCAANGVGDRVTCAETPIADVAEVFPLVLANIQAHVLLEMRPALTARVAPGGALVLSGLLTTQAGSVASDYAALGFTVEEIRPSTDDPQWSSVRLRQGR